MSRPKNFVSCCWWNYYCYLFNFCKSHLISDENNMQLGWVPTQRHFFSLFHCGLRARVPYWPQKIYFTLTAASHYLHEASTNSFKIKDLSMGKDLGKRCTTSNPKCSTPNFTSNEMLLKPKAYRSMEDHSYLINYEGYTTCHSKSLNLNFASNKVLMKSKFYLRIGIILALPH